MLFSYWSLIKTNIKEGGGTDKIVSLCLCTDHSPHSRILSLPAGPATVGHEAAVLAVNVRVWRAAWGEAAGAAGPELRPEDRGHPGLPLTEH